MNTLKATAATLGLLALVAAGSAQATPTPLFDLNNEPLYGTPTFGVSTGLAIIDDGSLTGTTPVQGRRHQLLLDSQGTTDFSNVLGSHNVPAFPVAISTFTHSFTTAVATTFQFTYNFLTSQDSGGKDFFVASLYDAALTQLDLAFESSGGSTLFASASGYLWETGTRYVEFSVGAGTWTTQFILGTNQTGCVDFQSACIPTGVVINAIPAPTTLALVALALVGVAAPRLRRRALAA